jgi:hypothetical protein
VKHIGKPDIVDILAEPANQARIFAPLNLGADRLAYRHGISTYRLLLLLPFDFLAPTYRPLPLFCRVQDRVDDVLIAGAAAEVPVESVADLFFAGLGVSF